MNRLIVLAAASLLLSGAGRAQTPARPQQPGASPSAASPDINTPRPIEAADTVMMEEMTWMEIRDAMRAGKKTVIVPTGGVEQNGPYLTTGKHNFVLRATAPAIARKLGNALVAPIVGFVPEGDIDPPTGHMKYPGTVSLQDATFRALLTDIASSFKSEGFEHIILIGDSGGNQTGMKAVAEALSAKWGPGGTTVHFIPEYYDYPGTTKWVEETLGIKQRDEGLHDDIVISSTIMTVDPAQVRMKQRITAGKFSINGVDMGPAEKTIELGKKIVDHRADVAVAAIKKALGRATH
jgi:creatinine amidohydrolase